MNWIDTVVFYLGLLDATAIMLGGFLSAILTLLDYPTTPGFNDRLWTAIFTILGSSIAAAIILAITKHFYT